MAKVAVPWLLAALMSLAVPASRPLPARADSRETPTWMDLARRFTGESDEVREKSLAELRKMDGLADKLRAALSGSDKFLALDVIAALPLPALYPDLVRLSQDDPSGYFYHALNALVTPDNRAEIAQLYRTRVTREGAASPAKMALIDTLGRLQSQLTEGDVAKLLGDPSYEVRASTIAYVRNFLRYGEGQAYVALLARPLSEGPFQLRIQVLTLAGELSKDFTHRLGAAWNRTLEPCADPEKFSPPLDEEEQALCAKAIGVPR